MVVGRIGGAYGVRGWVRLTSYTDPPDNLLHYAPWYLRRSGVWRGVDVREIRAHGEGFVAALAGVQDRDAALALGGCRIGVPAASFPPPRSGEYYWRELIGMRVVNSDGAVLGTVERLIETGAHDVLVIAGERERLIPFARQFVTAVVPKQGVLRVDWRDI